MSDFDKEGISVVTAEHEAPQLPMIKPSPDNSSNLISPENQPKCLFELEMWVRCIISFFSIHSHPLSETELKDITLRDFREELKIVRLVTLNINYLTHRLLTAQKKEIDYNQFIQEKIKKIPLLNSSFETFSTQAATGESLLSFTETLTDFRNVIDNLLKSPLVGLQTFISLGKIFCRETKSSQYINLLLLTKFKPPYDNIENVRLNNILKTLPNENLQQFFEKIFLEFFRILKYLDFISTDLVQDRPLKVCLIVFSLIRTEIAALTEFMENRLLTLSDMPTAVYNSMDGCVYALQMDLKKVYGRELIGFATLGQPPLLYAKTENSHGLLRDSIQQSIVSLVQIFDDKFEGQELFNSFQTRLDQSVKLRLDIWKLLCTIRNFEKDPDPERTYLVTDQMANFRDTSLKYLMYKDWDDFQRLTEESMTTNTIEDFRKSIHVFSTFLEALLGQINMRAVLASHPFDYPEI